MTEHQLYDTMIRLIPDCLSESKAYDEIMRAYARMFMLAYEVIERAARNIYLDTSAEALPFHARDLGISIAGMSTETARETIQATYFSLADIVTEERIIKVADAYANSDMVIRRTADAGRYIFEFTSQYGIPSSMASLDKIFRRMIGAEYVWSYKYRYMTWNEFDAYNKQYQTWDDLNLIWDKFEVYSERS